MRRSAPPKLVKFPASKQRRLDQLLDKNSEGTITVKERTTLKLLVAEAEQVMVTNARRLAAFRRHESAGAPAGAVPVTVWVHPESAGR
jgi:hypothetical protein